jgi:hypothetical protein
MISGCAGAIGEIQGFGAITTLSGFVLSQAPHQLKLLLAMM